MPGAAEHVFVLDRPVMDLHTIMCAEMGKMGAEEPGPRVLAALQVAAWRRRSCVYVQQYARRLCPAWRPGGLVHGGALI